MASSNEESEKVTTAGVEAAVSSEPPRSEAASLQGEEAAAAAAAALSANSPDSGSASESDQPPQEPHNLLAAQEALRGGIFTAPTDHPTLRLCNIRLGGTSAARPSFLEALCGPYLSQPNALQRLLHSSSGRLDHPAPGQATTMREILALSAGLADDLRRLDLFKSIDVALMPAPTSSPEDVDIVMQLRDSPRFWLKSSSDVGNGEGSVSLQARIRNIFGGAERLEGSYELGTRTRTALNVQLTTPIAASPDHQASLSLFNQERDKRYYGSHFEAATGLKAALAVANPRKGSSHELAWELTWRRIGRLAAQASRSTRRSRGDDIKSALAHTYIRDTRDEIFMGQEGSLLKSTTELASGWLGGERDHLRWEGEGSVSRSFQHSEGYGWSLGARTGFMTPLPSPSASNSTSLHPSDLFHLGGPTSLRMFGANSLGPKDAADSLGGSAFWSLGGSLYAPIPHKEHWPLKLHSFCNAGQLSRVDGQSARSAARELIQPSSSVGFGLLYTQGPLRLELNAGMPITARAGDGVRKGLQIGIGIDFLGG
ncbi:unnamed protein product [Jaminaea pallidilutea]